MDSDRFKGKAKDVAGRVERQAGEWTGNEDMQAEGTKNQVAGKVQNTAGKIKDAGRDALDRLKNDADRDEDTDSDIGNRKAS
jgi:uncharacterized protein YjbJ (UPF0337 family)